MRLISFLVLLLRTSPGIAYGSWQTLAPGMDLATFPASQPSKSADSRITVLCIDPDLWSLELIGLGVGDESSGLTAKQWSKTYGLTAAINEGMYATDYSTHVGYLRFRDHMNNDNVNATSLLQLSILAVMGCRAFVSLTWTGLVSV